MLISHVKIRKRASHQHPHAGYRPIWLSVYRSRKHASISKILKIADLKISRDRESAEGCARWQSQYRFTRWPPKRIIISELQSASRRCAAFARQASLSREEGLWIKKVMTWSRCRRWEFQTMQATRKEVCRNEHKMNTWSKKHYDALDDEVEVDIKLFTLVYRISPDSTRWLQRMIAGELRRVSCIRPRIQPREVSTLCAPVGNFAQFKPPRNISLSSSVCASSIHA